MGFEVGLAGPVKERVRERGWVGKIWEERSVWVVRLVKARLRREVGLVVLVRVV